MATVSTVSAFKAALVTRLRARTLILADEVQVEYGDPEAPERAEAIILAGITGGDQEPAALKSGTRRRRENYIVDAWVVVRSKTEFEANELRAIELAAEIEDELAVTPKFDEVPNLLWARPIAVEITTARLESKPRTTVQLSIDVHGNLQ